MRRKRFLFNAAKLVSFLVLEPSREMSRPASLEIDVDSLIVTARVRLLRYGALGLSSSGATKNNTDFVSVGSLGWDANESLGGADWADDSLNLFCGGSFGKKELNYFRKLMSRLAAYLLPS